MGVNYGQFRNRLEELKGMDPVIMSYIGDTDIDYWIYDYTQVADIINKQLDETQRQYNKRYNFPNVR